MARELGEPAARLQVTLVEATRRLLNGFSTRSSRAALANLRRRGVDVRLGQTVQAANARHVTLGDGEQIQTSTVIQAAGVTANGLGRGLGLHVSDHGRIVVNSRLQAADHPDVFPPATWLRSLSRRPDSRCRCSPRWPSSPGGTRAGRLPG